MQIQQNISPVKERGTLKDFAPLVFAFFACLVLLSLYQNVRLYVDGVLDSFLNKSLLLLILHNLGFAAITGLILVFVFNILEGIKPDLGFKMTKAILFGLLLMEGLLIDYYVREYEILDDDIFKLGVGADNVFRILTVISMSAVLYFVFKYLYKGMASVYQVVSRMYPFTIILFSLFLAILNSDKKPINENKTQHFVVHMIDNALDFNTYEGTAEFPLVKAYQNNDELGKHFKLKQKKPNIVLLIVEGLGDDFIGNNASYPGFMPYLDSLAKDALYWENYLSNSGVGFPALTSIVGSLPFGKMGFTNAENFIHRQTLFSLLKKNGYQTRFYYGGNSALNHFDKFLEEEQLDFVLDKKGFGSDYRLQTADMAGITLGYPDKALFKKWETLTKDTSQPSFEVFYTLSTQKPYSVPGIKTLKNTVEDRLVGASLSERQKRLVGNNTDVFASLLYADNALGNFIESYKKRPEYGNTIFVITGSHNLTDLPQYDELGRYKVPLIISSPLLKKPAQFNTLASHADIAPSLIKLLDHAYDLEIPKEVTWLGEGLVSDKVFQRNKAIPLFRDKERIKDYILGNHFITKGKVYTLDESLGLSVSEADDANDLVAQSFKEFRAINTYVVEKDKIVPKQKSLVVRTTPEFSKPDLIWIESAFNGRDFDNAYETAKELAFDKEWDRSLLLCNYILTKIPGHADTEILMGRIQAWKTNYKKAAEILNKAIQKYPVYEDGYAALFDVYFWSKQPKKAILLSEMAVKNKVHSTMLTKKVHRAKAQLKRIEAEKDLVATVD